MIPRSQKKRPISFLLFDREEFVAGRDLIIRPDELSRNEPFKNTVQQTLGGAWLDDFGMSISTISISGHTGWHGSKTEDGAEQFIQLRDLIVNRMKAEKDRKAKSGDPNDIKLVFADQLDNIVVYVAPQTFQLRRHKSRPLLMMYSMTMSVLGELDHGHRMGAFGLQDAIVQAINNPTRWELTDASLAHVSKKQTQLNGLLTGAGLPADLTRMSRDLMVTTGAILNVVREKTNAAMGVIDDNTAAFVHSSAMILEASRNVFQVAAAVTDTAAYGKSILQGIASNLNDAVCNLRNGYRRLFSMPDWSDLYGASACSSTGGGRPASPLAFENPFYQVYPNQNGAGLQVNADAAKAAAAMRGDMALNTPSLPAVIDAGSKLATVQVPT